MNVCVCVISSVVLNSCDPIDCSLTVSSVHWIFQARILARFKNSGKNGLPFPPPGDLPDPRIEPYLSVQFSRSVVSDSLWPHESQHARPPCPSPTPRVHPDSRLSNQWCHPAISSSVIPFSSCPLPSQHQSLFPWVNSMPEVTKVLEFQLQHQSFQWTPRTDLL